PFIATLVAQGAWHWARMAPSVRSAQLRRSCIFGVLTWQILAALFTWPAYLGSFNLLAGPRERYSHWSIGADFDWGQDLRRLAEYVHKKKIPRIAVRYFGGGKPEYYLAEKLMPLPPPTVDLPHGEYVAISIHLLELARSKVKDGVPAKDDEWLTWFDRHTPIATVGTTILIYRSGET
ncbi:MAG: hypothetical protein J0M12_17765, partial [Deltaproteobacteria bacterium]|nr:hypothetical protein [Deltaproteobacteria bacterium]